jgi:DNA-binding transcriptional ArsR family regulator
MEATSAGALLFPAEYRRKALALLCLDPSRHLHIRQIARLTGTAPGTMAKELERLARAGLLKSHRIGNQVHFSAQPAHPVFAELSGLLRKTVGLADVLMAALAGLADRIQVALVHGPIAHAEDHTARVIDLLIVGDAEFAEVTHALTSAQQALQRQINPQIMSASQWRTGLAAGSGFLADVLQQPKIFLIAGPDELARIGLPKHV